MSGEPAIELRLEGDGKGLTARLGLPLRVTVHGVEAVLVSASAYDALSIAAGKSVGVRSRIERDPEVQRFIDERLSTHELPTLRTGVAERFGRERTPSLSGLHRYAMARRQAAEGVTTRGSGRRGSQGPG